MKRALDFETLRRTNVQRCVAAFNHRLRDWTLADWTIAFGGEVGEALNVVKKLNRDRDGFAGNAKSAGALRYDLFDEIADALIYLDLLLAREDLQLCPWARDFAELQIDAVNRLADMATVPSLSEAGRKLMRSAGALAAATEDAANAGAIGIAARAVLEDITVLAELSRCDLGSAVVHKFNATSQQRGATERLFG